jgi:hypothetical protein
MTMRDDAQNAVNAQRGMEDAKERRRGDEAAKAAAWRKDVERHAKELALELAAMKAPFDVPRRWLPPAPGLWVVNVPTIEDSEPGWPWVCVPIGVAPDGSLTMTSPYPRGGGYWRESWRDPYSQGRPFAQGGRIRLAFTSRLAAAMNE